MQLLKRHIPIAVAFVLGVVMFFQFFIPTRFSNDFLTNILQWARVVAGFAMLLGIYSLLNYHYHKLRRRTAGWGFSVVVYVGFFAMVIAGLVWGPQNELPLKIIPPTGEPYQVQVYNPFQWMFDYMLVPMQATMFSILAFYIASAAYRAFRARTREATVLLITAIVVMLGRVPLGAQMINHYVAAHMEAGQMVAAHWAPVMGIGGKVQLLPWLTEWILNIPSMAAQRGIMIGIGLGSIGTSLRIIFGIERTYMGGGE